MTRSSLLAKLEIIYNLRLHAPRSSLADRSDYRTLLERLDNPHKRLPPAVHIAGTNGKGSTLAFLKAMYEAAGYKVHTYTSPHLVRFNERIGLGGQDIADDLLETYLDHVMNMAQGLQVTFFEITTALAFLAFSRQPANICLIETGMGGRLDCTNIIEAPLATIITRISYDHCQYLGSTLSQIATEKAGIMKPDRPCIIGYQQGFQGAPPSHDSETLPFESIAGQIGTPLHRAGREWSVSFTESDPIHFTFRYGSLQKLYPIPYLVGAHQLENAGAALACTHVIDSFPIHDESRATGLTRVRWAARLQRLDHHPLQGLIPEDWELWLDGGHNDSAGEVLARQAQAWHVHDPRPLHLVMGMKRDKQADQFLAHILPHLTSISLLTIPGMEEQSHDPLTLRQLAQSRRPDLAVACPASLNDALRRLAQAASCPGRILIAGSLFLAAYILGQEPYPLEQTLRA
ncbi:MAG: bifunctional folylpolyglutamate synthase/dihydrofolate synthase [Micavibrio aeruginosavorus]|uniref:tetrahydrofolate synthase n=1 Tax=Micavibrio aeruginosavorus TaxID=349221 RepID=A0A7T5R2C0_9BACT|nr:MAG: bifunctional folylpolyglutamate synthase/dihydrofolate synthase [Micavibrio aeruginosavorus]